MLKMPIIYHVPFTTCINMRWWKSYIDVGWVLRLRDKQTNIQRGREERERWVLVRVRMGNLCFRGISPYLGHCMCLLLIIRMSSGSVPNWIISVLDRVPCIGFLFCILLSYYICHDENLRIDVITCCITHNQWKK